MDETAKAALSSAWATEWDDIGAVLGSVFVGIFAILFLAVYVKQWLTRPRTSESLGPRRKLWRGR